MNLSHMILPNYCQTRCIHFPEKDFKMVAKKFFLKLMPKRSISIFVQSFTYEEKSKKKKKSNFVYYCALPSKAHVTIPVLETLILESSSPNDIQSHTFLQFQYILSPLRW